MKCSSKIEAEALLQQDRTNEAFEETIEIIPDKVSYYDSSYLENFSFLRIPRVCQMVAALFLVQHLVHRLHPHQRKLF